jgi:predicted nucleotidyltransferase
MGPVAFGRSSCLGLLFGSVARGESKENSDIDMLVSITKPIGSLLA